MDILDRDRKQIETQILAEFDTSEIVYLEQALELLKLKEDKIKIQYEKPKVACESTEQIVPTVFEKKEINEVKLDWFDVTDEGAACLESIDNKMESLNVNVQSNLNPEAKPFECELDDNTVEEFPLIESPTNENIPSDESIFADIDKQNQTKYFYFYQG